MVGIPAGVVGGQRGPCSEGRGGRQGPSSGGRFLPPAVLAMRYVCVFFAGAAVRTSGVIFVWQKRLSTVMTHSPSLGRATAAW